MTTSPEQADTRGAPALLRFPCAQCGAKLEFAPGTDHLRCPYCKFENPIPAGAAADGVVAAEDEQDFHGAIAALATAAPKSEVATVKCDACAAEVTKPPNVTSLTCPFCGSNIVATDHTATVIKPNVILPFKVTRDQAIATFRGWLRSRWFAPNALKSEGRLDASVTGVYLPAWTYDTTATTRYTGQRGDAYYVTQTVTVMVNGKPQLRTQQVRKIRWTPASGVVDNEFDDVLVLASRTLPDEKVRTLEPWDIKAVVPFAPEYLAGFRAETYTIDLPEGFELAKQIVRLQIEATIRADIGGDEQRISSMQSRWFDITFKLLLLPLWISAYRYQNRVFRFLVNARTGEVQGERPYSALKITLFTVMCLVIAGIIALVVALKN